jgi:hypothetical protein
MHASGHKMYKGTHGECFARAVDIAWRLPYICMHRVSIVMHASGVNRDAFQGPPAFGFDEPPQTFPPTHPRKLRAYQTGIPLHADKRSVWGRNTSHRLLSFASRRVSAPDRGPVPTGAASRMMRRDRAQPLHLRCDFAQPEKAAVENELPRKLKLLLYVGCSDDVTDFDPRVHDVCAVLICAVRQLVVAEDTRPKQHGAASAARGAHGGRMVWGPAVCYRPRPNYAIAQSHIAQSHNCTIAKSHLSAPRRHRVSARERRNPTNNYVFYLYVLRAFRAQSRWYRTEGLSCPR